MTKAMAVAALLLLAGCKEDSPTVLFSYCIANADARTPELVIACRETAWPERKTAEKGQTP